MVDPKLLDSEDWKAIPFLFAWVLDFSWYVNKYKASDFWEKIFMESKNHY